MDHQAALSGHATERYLLNELAAAERDEFEEHYFECAECAADVGVLGPFAANLKAELRSIPLAKAPPKESRSWFGWLNPAWLSPAMAMLALFGFGWQTMRLNRPIAWSPQAVAGETRGAASVVEMASGGGFAIALDIDAPPGVTQVEISIEDPAGAKLVSLVSDAPTGGSPLNFGLRKPGFGPGKYVAVIRTPDGKELSRHPFDYVRTGRRLP